MLASDDAIVIAIVGVKDQYSRIFTTIKEPLVAKARMIWASEGN